MNSRRRIRPSFVVVVIVAASALSIWLIVAQNFNRPPVVLIPAGMTAQAAYGQAEELLLSGKKTVRAIALLQHAIKLDPANVLYHDTLGDAYTARAAFIWRALVFRTYISQQRTQYWKDIVGWEWYRAIGHSTGSSRPVDEPYHEIHLKDDGTFFRYTEDQAESTIVSLNNQADAQYLLALHSSNSPVLQAHVWSCRSSSQFIFAIMHKTGFMSTGPPAGLRRLPDYLTALRSVQSAEKLQPSDALYWQQIGDLEDRSSGTPEWTSFDGNIKPTRKYYIESLRLQPNNEILWMKLCSDERWSTAKTQYRNDLANAIRYNNDNSCLSLLYCESLFSGTHYNSGGYNDPDSDRTKAWLDLLSAIDTSDKNALSQVEGVVAQAAKTRRFDTDSYRPSLPQDLSIAYTLVNIDDDDTEAYAPLRNCARECASAAYCEAAAGHPDEGVKLMRNLVLATAPMIVPGDFTRKSMANGSTIQALVGVAITSVALKQIALIYAKYGPTEKAVMAEKACADFRAEFASHRTAIEKWSTDDIYYYY